MLVLAAAVAERMGLPHNPAEAVLNATDKARQRQRWAAAGVAQPHFGIVPAAATDDAIRQAAEAVGFPCVVKAVSLSASQGILRADDPAAAVAAAGRIRQRPGRRPAPPASEPLLVEEYLPGPELSIDGLLAGGDLTVTAIFDKPATPDGPTFEETLLLTPSRLPGPVLAAAISTAGRAARALGLTCGPVHAELRIDERGGQPGPPCSNSRHAPSAACAPARCGSPAAPPWKNWCWPAPSASPPRPPAMTRPGPAGVFMLPVPRPGVLRAVEGRDRAAAVPGITGLTITIPVGQRVRPLPDGDRYLGFIFAEAGTRHEVEQALTAARDQLRVIID